MDNPNGKSVDVEFLLWLRWFPRPIAAQIPEAIMHNLKHLVKEERTRPSCLLKSTNDSDKETTSGGNSLALQQALKRRME